MSDLDNEAVRILLGEDAEDLADIKTREKEPTVSFEDIVADLKARGKL